MSDDKKGHVRPDSDGRWLVYAEGVEGAAYVYDVRMKDGHPTNAQTGGILAGGPGDQWYRCYVPGLDKPQNDIELLRDLYFKHRHEIADLRAERDEARQEVERLTRENQRLTDMAGAAQSQLGYWGVKVYPNDIARGIADLAQERDKCRLDAQSESLINEELRAELATLRQQQGKGEGDDRSNYIELCNDIEEVADTLGIGPGNSVWRLNEIASRYEEMQRAAQHHGDKWRGLAQSGVLTQLDESTKDLVVTVGNINAEIRCSKDPNTAWRWEGVVDHLLDQIDANRKALEASRAT